MEFPELEKSRNLERAKWWLVNVAACRTSSRGNPWTGPGTVHGSWRGNLPCLSGFSGPSANCSRLFQHVGSLEAQQTSSPIDLADLCRLLFALSPSRLDSVNNLSHLYPQRGLVSLKTTYTRSCSSSCLFPPFSALAELTWASISSLSERTSQPQSRHRSDPKADCCVNSLTPNTTI